MINACRVSSQCPLRNSLGCADVSNTRDTYFSLVKRFASQVDLTMNYSGDIYYIKFNANINHPVKCILKYFFP